MLLTLTEQLAFHDFSTASFSPPPWLTSEPQSEALPHLQSLVIILLKTIVHHVSVLASTPPQGQQQTGTAPNGPRPVNGVGPGRGADAPNGPNTSPAGDGSAPSDEEIDGNRNREITAKAVSGILLLLLKWLKLSRKFSSICQNIDSREHTDQACRRYTQIRVPGATSAGLELPPPDFEAICTSGYTADGRQQGGRH